MWWRQKDAVQKVRLFPPWNAHNVESRIIHRGERWSAYVVLSCTGLVGTQITQGSADSASFFDFLGTEVVPQLQPFPGPHSILMLDNWTPGCRVY